MNTAWRFPILIAASLVAFMWVLQAAMRDRAVRPPRRTLALVAAVVVIGGMTFAKYGATTGWPVWLYYGVPAAITWILPPAVFRMRGREIVRYVAMAVLVAPTIHVLFSLVLGWKEYMPFIPVPSIMEMIGR